MLGEMIGKTTGEVSGFRIIHTDLGPKVETNFEGKGLLLGIHVTEIVTFWAQVRMDGTFYGGADGIVAAEDGQNAMFRGNGVGRMTGENLRAWWRGALYYESMSPAFAGLSDKAVMFEYDIDRTGKCMDTQLWEWK